MEMNGRGKGPYTPERGGDPIHRRGGGPLYIDEVAH